MICQKNVVVHFNTKKLAIENFAEKKLFSFYTDIFIWMGMVGAVDKISLRGHRVPSSISGFAEIWIFLWTFFPPKLARLSIFLG